MSKFEMLAAVNIDLDGLDCYHAIHGLNLPDDPALVYDVALGRFRALLESLGIRATLFVITRYLEADGVVAPLHEAARVGHEIASHTHGHPYNLGRLSQSELEAEIDDAGDALEQHLGARPVGFRAPGYFITDRVLDALEARGYRYDSSVFPCPPYYAAKALIMAGMRLLGRRSGSYLTDPRALLAPIQPYRPLSGHFHRRGRPGRVRSLWEIPMCVAPGTRFPLIGTSLTLLGSRGFDALYPILRRTHPVLNLEFHGADFLDASDEGVTAALLEKQPDLRRPVAEKTAIYRHVLERALEHYEFVTLDEMTSRLG